jgi:BMFP domain-containing protein YqiC
MTQSSGRLFDGLGRVMTDVVGLADNAKREIETIVRNQAERILSDLDLVRREEFEAARELAANARRENEALSERLLALEGRISVLEANAPVVTPAPVKTEATPAENPQPGL